MFTSRAKTEKFTRH
ncbi:hypothetical protein [Porphyromonas gingivalis]